MGGFKIKKYMAETILGYNDSILLYNNCMIRVNYGSSTWGDASGGIITYDGDYKIHTFNSSDNFIVYSTIDASVLIVGGGGSGANISGGGGGEVIQTSFTLNQGTYPVIVGIGGYSASTGLLNGIDGNISTFNNVDASGGKGSYSSSYTSGYGGASGSGYAGGISAFYLDAWAGGGGGGDSSTGLNGQAYSDGGKFPVALTIGGTGGAGTHSSISGSDVGYGGGGGGAALYGIPTKGLGQDGGGDGFEWQYTAATAGTPNTGGGGGGNGTEDQVAGGSGVVIIRYKYQ